MEPAALIPVADALPVSWVLLLVMLTATAFLHFVAMNVMLGTGFVAFATYLKKGEQSQPLMETVAGTLTYSTALTVNMGVAPLLFLQALYGQFFYTSTVLMAVYWLFTVLLLIISYYSIYIYKMKFSARGGGLFFLGLPVGLMLIISLIFSNNISLMQMPVSWLDYFENPGGWLLNFGDGALLPRYLHFILSAIAVGGLAIAVLYESKKGGGVTDCDQWIKSGCDWFTKATLANFGAGFWFLGTLPANVFGSAAPLSGLLIIFVVVSVFTIVPAMVAAHRVQAYRAAAWTLATIFLMTIAREIARISYLQPYLKMSELPVVPQYGPFVIFLVVAAAVIWLLWWMFAKVRMEMEVNR